MSRKIGIVWAIGLLCLLCGVGCSEPPPFNTTFVLSDQEKPLFTVTSEGGVFCSNSGLCLHFPPQAVTESTSIRGRVVPPPQGAVGFAYQLETQSPSFAKDIMLELPVPSEYQQAGLVVAFLEGTQWKSVPTQVSQGIKTRTGTSRHLSQWTLFPAANCQNGTCLSSPPSCPTGQTQCGSQCVNLQTDKNHCGACKTACQGSDVCDQGKCAPPATNCTGGNTLCSGVCVDLQSDNNHCGRCGSLCINNSVCQQGKCVPPATNCTGGKTLCNGVCVDLQTDNNHCGACGAACTNNSTCQQGKCVPPVTNCTGGKTLCSGVCVDLQTDNNHCGACGAACQSGETCQQGKCAPTHCPNGLTRCAGSCVDVSTDSNNCGSCGTACPTGQVCQAGSCKTPNTSLQSCYTMLCGGTCVEHVYDENNCGACGLQCKAGDICCGGKCIAQDDKNCGGCRRECLPHHSCQSGVCKLRPSSEICPTGFTYCSGYCVDLKSNRLHCGACGKSCGSNTACTNGVCSGDRYKSCRPGGPVCKGQCQNGPNGIECRTCDYSPYLIACDGKCVGNVGHLETENCGECGNRCPKGTFCSGDGKCGELIQPPANSNLMCDDIVMNSFSTKTHCGGCYKSCSERISCYFDVLNYDCCQPHLLCEGRCWGRVSSSQSIPPLNPNHCGACNQVCPQGQRCDLASPANKNPCHAGSPNQGWTWCGKRWGHLADDALNCGACGNVCPNGHYCEKGQCIQCPSGQIFCNGQCVAMDEKNCGTCGNTCATGFRCAASSGTYSCQCPSGLTDCSGTCVNTKTDLQNCGACGTVCQTNNVCTNGACIIQCPTGLTACSGQCVNLRSDSKNCGKCGNVCPSGEACASSICAKNWAISNDGRVSDLAVDSSGNVYVTGKFSGQILFGTLSLNSSGGGLFVVKLNTAGAYQWAVNMGGTSTDIAVDNSGNVYLAGSFRGSARIGSITLQGAGSGSQPFAARLNASGTVQWAKTFGNNTDVSLGVGVDGSGNAYAAAGQIHSSTNDSRGISVTKFNASGTQLWSVTGGKRVADGGLAVGPSGNAYVAGRMEEVSVFGTTTLTPASQVVMFVAKLNTQGVFQWAKAVQGGGIYSDLTLDPSENSYLLAFAVKGGSDLNPFLAKYDSQGVHQWSFSINSSGWEWASSVAVDTKGNSYILSTFENIARFGSTFLTSAGSNDIVVMKVSPSGKLLSASPIGSKGRDEPLSIGCDGNDNYYISTEMAQGSVFFDAKTLKLKNSGVNLFIAKNIP